MSSFSLASTALPAPPWPQSGVQDTSQAGQPTPLDDPREWDAFSRPRKDHPDQLESSVAVEGMHCAACSLTVEQALLGVPGVVAASVSASGQRAQVTWRPAQVLPSGWMQAVAMAGYRLVPLQDSGARARRQADTRQALWRWGVAGLGMMQVMMYAYPAYIAQPGEIPGELEQLLRWASWVISLPVLLFSCGPFFRQAWRDLLQRRVSMDLPVALGIAITFAISTVGTFEPLGPFGHEVYFDSLTMFVFFLLSGRWLELRLRDRTAGALEALISRLPDGVERQCADGSFERVAARRVVAGDVLRVHAGETFVADALVQNGHTQVDEALLTGESQAVHRGPGASVVAGSHNLSGTVLVQVLRAGQATRFAQIVSLMESAAASKPAAARLADALARPFLLAVLAAAALGAAWNWGQGPAHALMVAVAVLVVTCPCALSLAAPAALLASAGALARQGIWVRRLQALETLATVDTVVFDKTGTLTEEAMNVGAIHTRAGVTPQQALAMACALAKHSLHPVSRALCAAAPGEVQPAWHCAHVVELTGRGLRGIAHGNTQTAALRLGTATFCRVQRAPPTTGTCVHLSDRSGWLASFDIAERLRPQAAQAVEALRQDGVTVRLMSGDTPQAVAPVAAAAGIRDMQAQCSPDGKLALLRQLQAQGHRVAMVGDGLNDGPVLAGAEVSFAFGRSVPLAQAQADVVMPGGRLMDVAHTLRRARSAVAVVRQNLVWALVYNAACVPLAIVGWLPAWLAGLGMAGSSLLVVLNAARLATSLSTEGAATSLPLENP